MEGDGGGGGGGVNSRCFGDGEGGGKLAFKGALSDLRQFLAAESPLKVMKNAFYFTSKAVLIHKICKFLSWFFGRVAKRFDRKDKVNFKFHDVTAWLTCICNHILTNISRRKGNQTMKLGHRLVNRI